MIEKNKQKIEDMRASEEPKRNLISDDKLSEVRGQLKEEKSHSVHPAIHYYRAIYKHLKKNMDNKQDRSFHLTKKMVRNQFDKNKNLTDPGQIDMAINKAASYLHSQRAWSLDNDRSTPLERHNSELSDLEKDSIEDAELEQGKQNLDSSPAYWNQYFQQAGSEDEKYCDFDIIKNYLYAYNKNTSTRICVVGCGLSTVGTSLLGMKRSRDVLQVDFSEVAIKHQSNIHKDVAGMRFKEMDVLKEYLPETSFDLVFDKGLFDNVLSSGSEEDLDTLERNIWMSLRGKGVYFLVSITPIDGIRTMFCSHDWEIKKLGCYNMSTYETIDGMTEEEENEDYESNVNEAVMNPHVHFYVLVKPDIQ
ncbi:methyltransferase-like protein [Acrasis kona]|uniref:Methyltransferase-like protein n=1 Tax=Acrasis kona TaxID=1008807 RepID=A0AAW2ZH39_9EUKA